MSQADTTHIMRYIHNFLINRGYKFTLVGTYKRVRHNDICDLIMSTVFRGTIKQLFIGEQLGEINNDTADVVSLLRRDEYVYYELCNYRREAGRYFEDSLDIYISPTHTRNEERLYEVGMFLYPSTEVNSSIYPLILGSRVY